MFFLGGMGRRRKQEWGGGNGGWAGWGGGATRAGERRDTDVGRWEMGGGGGGGRRERRVLIVDQATCLSDRCSWSSRKARADNCREGRSVWHS